MTGAAADRFRLERRGCVREGYAADIVVFDWDQVRDGANRTGDAAPSGVEHVFINGRPAIEAGAIHAVRGAGEVLLS